MILVDTSVLISYFKGQENEATKKFEKILTKSLTTLKKVCRI